MLRIIQVHRFPAVLLLLLTLLVALPIAPAPVAAQELPLTYDVIYDYNDGQYTYRYAALQGPELTLIEEVEEGTSPSFALKEAMAATGPAVGNAPATIEGATGETEILVPYFYGPDAFHPGRTKKSESFGEVEVLTIDSLRYSLTRGTRDTVIAGREAQHYVLNAARYQHTDNAEGEQIEAGAERARHDLWFVSDLPFSAAPFVALGKPFGAFMPMVSNRADAEIWHGLKDRLRALGLLVRAEQYRFQKGYSRPTHRFMLEVRNIRPAEETPPALGSHIVFASKEELRAHGVASELGMELFMAAVRGDAPTSFTGSVSGEGYERSLRGPALFTPATGENAFFKGFTLFLSAGDDFSQENPAESGLLGGVVLQWSEKGLPEPGTYELMGLAVLADEETEGRTAESFTIGAMIGRAGEAGFRERATFTEVSGGTLTIESAGPQRVQGRLEVTLSGYVMPGHTEPVEVTLTGTFEATPGLER